MKILSLVNNKKYPKFIRNYYAKNPTAESVKWFSQMGLKNFSEVLPEDKAAPYKGIALSEKSIFNKNFFRDGAENILTIIGEATHDYDLSKIDNALALRLVTRHYYNISTLYEKLSGKGDTNWKNVSLIDRKVSSKEEAIKALDSELSLLDASSDKIVSGYDRSELKEDIGSLQTALMPLLLKAPTKEVPEKLEIVFASEGKQGIWDIATMSMRGIDSCMRWGSSNSESLIGSIKDPCCGVIYLTNNKPTKFGTRMLARSVVRIVSGINGPEIIVDDPYVANSKLNKNVKEITELFKDFLEKKMDKKFSIHKKIPNKQDTYGNKRYKVPSIYKSKETLIGDKASYRDGENAYTKKIFTAEQIFNQKPKKSMKGKSK